MCGISGCIFFDEKAETHTISFKRANNMLRHRGPDGEGYFIFKNIGLAHRRLAIIDTSEKGNQPISNEDGSVICIFNGEIYNYLQLKKELLEKGHLFSSSSDTEVLVHLYEEKQERLLSDLEGMFAFALYDKKRRKLFLARDCFGIKPLYYKVSGNKFIFASEIKAILSFERQKGNINYESLLDYFAYQYIMDRKTLFQNIYKLLPGQYLIFQNRNFSLHSYWDPSFCKTDRSLEDTLETFCDLFMRSVKKNLQSDVPLGFHLSGGVDTAAIVGSSKIFLKSAKIKTYSSWFEGDSTESQIAQDISAHFNTSHRSKIYTHKDFMEILPKVIWFLDEPLGDPGVVAQYFTNQIASSDVKVILSGHGADETLGGYARHILFYLDCLLKDALTGKRTQKLSLPDVYEGLSFLSDYRHMVEKFFSQNFFTSPFDRYNTLVMRTKEYKDILHPDLQNTFSHNPEGQMRNLFINAQHSSDSFDNVLFFDMKAMLPPLLHMEDRMSMAHSIETRVPFLDRRLVEYSLSVPTSIKLHKGILKYLVRGGLKKLLPVKTLQRKKKIGRPIPLNKWMQKKEFKHFIKSILLSPELEKRHIFKIEKIKEVIELNKPFDRTLWGILCFEMWCQQYID